MSHTAVCEACGDRRELPDGSRLEQRDGQVVAITRPSSAGVFERAGLTEKEASDEARIIGLRSALCPACGGVYVALDRRAPVGCVTAAAGCLGAALLFISPLLDFIFRSGRRVLALVAAVLVVVSLASYWLQGRRFRAGRTERRPLDDERCCATATRKTVVFAAKARRRDRFPCPACRQQTVRVETPRFVV